MRALPESTERLLYAIDRSVGADGLVLAGGTALALRIEHRRSGDLDFVFPAKRLPRKKLSQLIDTLNRSHAVERFPNVAAEQEFLESGLDLAAYQQDYSIDGVKVTFFVPEPAELAKHVSAESGVAGLKRICVARLSSLFMMKAVVLNSRVTARDLFDVYTLIEAHGFSGAELFNNAKRFGFSPDVLKTRLLCASRRADDPGLEAIDGAAPGFQQLTAYFAELIDREEQTAAAAYTKRRRTGKAARAKSRKKPGGGGE